MTEPKRSLAPRTIAAIDVGSNSIKLLVARTSDGETLDVIAREKAMVRLGRETLQTGRLSEGAIEAGVDCIKRLARLAEAAGAERVVVAATCAVREASNGAELARRVRESTDLVLEVISGEEEARLITRAVRTDFAPSADPLLVIDIGGGSTEVIVTGGAKTSLAESLELGAVRLTERFVTQDPMGKVAAAALIAEVDARLSRVARAVNDLGFRTAVGTSGTIEALVAVAAAADGRKGASSGHRTLTRRSLRRVATQLVGADARERLLIPGVEKDRADILAAGALLLLRLLERFSVKELHYCDRSLREGLVLEALEGDRPAATDGRDVRQESVSRLARRCHVEWPHAEKTRDLALRLFDQTHALHQLAERERDWLAHAAFLHDIGNSISYLRHHRHTAYLIEHAELKGFSAEEIAVIALVARYHRKGKPKESHDAFARLDPWLKPVVEKLAALLRLADALDRGHRQLVTGLEVSIRRKKVVLTLLADGNPDLELWAAQEKSALFERVFGRSVELALRPATGLAPVIELVPRAPVPAAGPAKP